MPRFRLFAFLLPCLLIPLLPGCLPAETAPHWLEGEILSRRTIAPDRHTSHPRYVYRIRSGAIQYTVRFDRPLSMRLYSPLTFAVSRRHLLVQDADGTQLKAHILKKSEPALRQ